MNKQDITKEIIKHANGVYKHKAKQITTTDWRTVQEVLDSVWWAFLFKWDITISADFPLISEVTNWWTYRVTADVIDDDPTKTNTWNSFKKWDIISYNWTDWTDITWIEVFIDDWTDVKTINERNIDLQNSWLKDVNVTTAITLWDAINTSLDPLFTATTILWALNENRTLVDDALRWVATVSWNVLIEWFELSINADNTKYDVAPWIAYMVDNYTDPANPTYTKIEFAGQTWITPTNLATTTTTYPVLQQNWTLAELTEYPTKWSDLREYIWLWAIVHSNLTNISSVSQQISQSWVDLVSTVQELANSIGRINRSGNIYSPAWTDLTIKRSAWEILAIWINAKDNKLNPNIFTTVSNDPVSSILYSYRDWTGWFVTASNTEVNPLNYDDWTWTLASVAVNKYTIQKIYLSVGSWITFIEYWQKEYNSMAEAITGKDLDTTEQNPLVANLLFRGWIIVKRWTTDLSNTSDALFFTANKFWDLTSSAGWVAISTVTLQQAYNNYNEPEILTDATWWALTIRQWSWADTDTILEWKNGTWTTTFSVDWNGNVVSNNLVTKVTSTDNAIVRFNGTTGEIQNSNITIWDSNNIIINTNSTEPFRINWSNWLFRIQDWNLTDTFWTWIRTFLWDWWNDIVLWTANSSQTPTNSYIALNQDWEISMWAGSSVTKDFVLDTNWNIGLWTDTPLEKLDIVDSSNVFAKIQTTWTATRSWVDLYYPTDWDWQYTWIRDWQAFAPIAIANARNTNDLIIKTWDWTVWSSERMRITSSGNVGIGMTPSKLLDLQANDNLALRFYNGATFKAGIEVATTSWDMIATSGIDDLAIRSNSNLIFSSGGNTERIRIDSSWFVGIGLSAPKGILHVAPVTDQTLLIKGENTVTGAVTINAVDNNDGVNIPLEIRSSKTVFSSGNVAFWVTTPIHQIHNTRWTLSNSVYIWDLDDWVDFSDRWGNWDNLYIRQPVRTTWGWWGSRVEIADEAEHTSEFWAYDFVDKDWWASTLRKWWVNKNANMFIRNTTSVPSTDANWWYLYIEGWALKYKWSSWTVTTIAAA